MQRKAISPPYHPNYVELLAECKLIAGLKENFSMVQFNTALDHHIGLAERLKTATQQLATLQKTCDNVIQLNASISKIQLLKQEHDKSLNTILALENEMNIIHGRESKFITNVRYSKNAVVILSEQEVELRARWRSFKDLDKSRLMTIYDYEEDVFGTVADYNKVLAEAQQARIKLQKTEMPQVGLAHPFFSPKGRGGFQEQGTSSLEVPTSPTLAMRLNK